MKTHTMIVYGILAFFILPSRVNGEATNQTTSPIAGVRSVTGWDRGLRTNAIYGKSTNGIRGEIEIISPDDPSTPTEIVVLVSQLNLTNSGHSMSNSMETILNKVSGQDSEYFMPTNVFCGPIELIDNQGRSLLPLKPELSSISSYPASYNMREAHSNYFRRYIYYSGPGVFPLPLMAASQPDELIRFQIGRGIKAKNPRAYDGLYERWFSLTDYFDIKEAGEYTFTVWPKIYKRLATNNENCERIDLPPVSATIKWNESSGK